MRSIIVVKAPILRRFPLLDTVPGAKVNSRKPTGNIITVRVGEGSWEIHRKVLVRSPYFERILKEEDLDQHEDGNFQADSTITFDQTTSDIFGLFNRWSYKDHIKEQNGKYPTVGRMIRLWVLGSILELPALQDLVMTGLCISDSVAGPSDYEYIYTNSNAECKLRKWSVDAIAANVSRDEMKGGVKANLTRMPKPMLIDLVISLKKLVPEKKERIDKGKYMVQRSVKRRDV